MSGANMRVLEQPAYHGWDSPGKNIGVGCCAFLLKPADNSNDSNSVAKGKKIIKNIDYDLFKY